MIAYFLFNCKKNRYMEDTEFLFKVLVVGDIGAGKTSFIKRYVHNIYSIHYKSTIGVDFALKVLKWHDEKRDVDVNVRLQLWDIAGQERFGTMTRVYYKEAVAAIIMFDVTRMSTFDAVQKWKADIDSKVMLADGNPIPVILLANKRDLILEEDSKEYWEKLKNDIDNFSQRHHFLAWFETSAKDGLNVELAVNNLVASIMENVPIKVDSTDSSIIDLNESEPDNTCVC